MGNVEKDLQARNVLSVELVAAYVRVSTQEQKLHGISLDAQKAKLQKYADEHNMKIVEWYVDEGVSGRKLIRNRPELQRMIQDAEKEKFERIIFIKLDRFFLNFRVTDHLLAACLLVRCNGKAERLTAC